MLDAGRERDPLKLRYNEHGDQKAGKMSTEDLLSLAKDEIEAQHLGSS